MCSAPSLQVGCRELPAGADCWEAAQVAAMERVSVPEESEFEARLRRVLTLTRDNTCSMLQDIKAGRKTEIGALNQALVQRAEAFGLSVPVNQMLASLVLVCHP